jgi:hypothetical protein
MAQRALTFAAVLITAALGTQACHREHPAEGKSKASVEWRPVGTWSGHGDAQTDSFDIGYTQVRIRWETRNEKPSGAGTFRVTVNSAVSGRDLTVAVDHNGVGHDVSYVEVDPHWSYLVITSANLDWKVTVEEPSVIENP